MIRYMIQMSDTRLGEASKLKLKVPMFSVAEPYLTIYYGSGSNY